MVRLKLTLFRAVFLLGFVVDGKAQLSAASTSTLLTTKNIMALSPSYIFEDPDILKQMWGNEPIPLAYYDDDAIRAQQMINNDVSDAIVTYAPVDASKEEWVDIDYEEITPYTWKWVSLELIKRNGSTTKISLRRPNWWIKAHRADSVGRHVYIDIPEMGSIGWGIVTGMAANQLDTRLINEDRNGNFVSRPITGKFEHTSDNVYDLVFDKGASIGVTGNHPIWSHDRNGWTEADDLEIGEQVITYSGLSKLISITKREEVATVYNIEVYRSHNYYVSESKILVHNPYTCWDKDWREMLYEAGKIGKPQRITTTYDGVIVSKTVGNTKRFLIPSLKNRTKDAITGRYTNTDLAGFVKMLKLNAKISGAENIVIRGSQIHNPQLAALFKSMSDGERTFMGLKVKYYESENSLGMVELSGSVR